MSTDKPRNEAGERAFDKWWELNGGMSDELEAFDIHELAIVARLCKRSWLAAVASRPLERVRGLVETERKWAATLRERKFPEVAREIERICDDLTTVGESSKIIED